MFEPLFSLKTGATFKTAISLPEYTNIGYFADCVLSGQTRQYQDVTSKGHIADLNVTFEDVLTSRVIWIEYLGSTFDWPIGPAEFDVKIIAPNGVVLFTKNIPYSIEARAL